ncbi:Gfo/Idh/MocA family oxidoreductase [Streptomyces sp. SID13031]|uniref:Gfo/Idh/MocA family protein n=1 Tax=Streptomyces sp. SID13031 TaxID=2706046 RepID=UPI0013C6BBE5|nr:Gfo/Idh/MocA family oxidoreductase [Streptomyces sp. SID13031]NEA37009.1 Gfo/Idh/MocA family oxidoreductase [Streptomyces sp. SID13031]
MTTAPIRLGIVGLGAMGRQLLARALDHPDFTVTHAVDLAPEIVAALGAEHPDISFSTLIADVIGAGDVDAVYIATPPATHAALAVPAFEAGQAVFCEKPLAVSDDDAAAMLEAAVASARAAAVNFSLSDRQSTRYVEQAIADGRVGDVLGVEIRLAFPVWPRRFQAGATWVGERPQGGFVREVFSHFAYLTDRLVGPLHAIHTELEHRSEVSETAAYGLLKAGEIPVQLSGIVGAAGPETYEWILRGTRQSFKLTAWRDLFVADGNDWQPVELTGELGSEATRLTLFAQAIRGDHSPDLAGFAAAERVRQVVEAFHR